MKNFTDFIATNQLFKKNNCLLVACSGGVDSIVLCDLLFNNGYKFQIAHCNFQLREAASDNDETFVKILAEKYKVPVHVKRFDTQVYAAAGKLSIQVAARELRYTWFNELLHEFHLDYLLTAHHADDNIETVLMNIFKGTGIAGFHGILPKRDKIIRPILFATKKDILQYAFENKLKWLEDASNATNKYTRNFIRHDLIPLVQKVIPNAAGNILQTIAHLQEVELLYNEAIEANKKKLLIIKRDEIHIPVLKFAAAKPFNTIAYEIIKPFGFTDAQLPDLQKLLGSETGKYLASTTHRIIKNRNWLIIAPIAPAASSTLLIETEDKIIVFDNGTLNLNMSNDLQVSPNLKIAAFDAKHIKFPLLLRRWNIGDYFYPLGMPKKKKIARFLIDQKLSKIEKEKVWIIESDQKIIWVVGLRIDDRFKITPNAKTVLCLTLVDK